MDEFRSQRIVWEQPTIEYGTSNGDGFFNLALDVTRVELKDNETVVYITAQQRSDYPNTFFRTSATVCEILQL